MTGSISAFCPACGSAFTPDARFCSGCGRAVDGRARPGGAGTVTRDRLPWLIAGGALAGVLGLLLVVTARGSHAGTAVPGVEIATTGESGAAVPDISELSPRERFDRLYNRVMQAAQTGDQATMTRFMPMALGAYEMLDSVDVDARYHAALLRIHSGDVDGSRALGDSILALKPGHLLGYVVLGTAAQWTRDDAGLASVYREFRSRYEGEIRSNRPEYAEHRASLDEFRRRAEAGS